MSLSSLSRARLAAAALFVLCGTGSAQAPNTVGFAMTADNAFYAYVSTNANSSGTLIHGSDLNFYTVETGSGGLVPGVVNYLQVEAYNFEPGWDWGGLIGQFSVNGPFRFANGEQTIATGATGMQVSGSGWGSGMTAATGGVVNGGGPWGYIGAIGAAAEWIWAGPLIPASGQVFLTVPIYPVPVESVANGGFELCSAPNYNLGAGSTAINDWRVEGGGVDHVVTFWVASEGQASVDLCGSNPGSISTALMLSANTSYRVEFDLAGNMGTPGVKTAEVSVEAVGSGPATASQVFVFDPAGYNINNMGWAAKAAVFITRDDLPAQFFARLRFSSLTPGPSGPVLDHVRVTRISGLGQANAPSASLKINGVGANGVAGPFAQEIDDQVGLSFEFGGPAFQPYILLGAFNFATQSGLGCAGSLDLGTAPTFGDVFVILDGLSFPGLFLFNTGPSGVATLQANAAGLPPGIQFAVQTLMIQAPGSPCPFQLTAAHHLIKR